MKNPIFIAEIKTKSIFGFESKYSRNTLIETALTNGDWISIHTDSRFGGSFDDIYQIKILTNKPVLAKGFHSHKDDVKKCFDLGADYVLSVDKYHPEFPIDKMLYELSHLDTKNSINWNNIQQLEGKFVYNGRDLRTGMGKNIGDYQEYRNKTKWLCGASLIKKPKDVELYYKDCDAFIVGENLVEFCKEYKK